MGRLPLATALIAKVKEETPLVPPVIWPMVAIWA